MKITNLYVIAIIVCAISMYLQHQLNDMWYYLVIFSIPAYLTYLMMLISTSMVIKILKSTPKEDQVKKEEIKAAQFFSGQNFVEKQKDYFSKKYQFFIISLFLVLTFIFSQTEHYLLSIIYALPLLDLAICYTKNKFIDISSILIEMKKTIIFKQKNQE